MSPAVATLYWRRKDCDAEREPYFSLLRANGCTPKYVMKKSRSGKGAPRYSAASVRSDCGGSICTSTTLRREAGSRWLDAGVPLHRILRWRGHPPRREPGGKFP
jgi:hypothetical protein